MHLLDLLRPPLPASDVVVPAHVGGRAAFSALLRDGALRDVGVRDSPGAALRSSVPDDVDRRATVLLRAGGALVCDTGAPLPASVVVVLETAAWLHAGGALPPAIQVTRRSGSRPPMPRPGLSWHELRLRPDDLELRGGLAVTTRVRTAADLALRLPAVHARRSLAPVLALVRSEDVIVRLEDEPRSGRACELVRAVAAEQRAREGQSCSAGASCAREPVSR